MHAWMREPTAIVVNGEKRVSIHLNNISISAESSILSLLLIIKVKLKKIMTLFLTSKYIGTD